MNLVKPSLVVVTALSLAACASKKDVPELDYKSPQLASASLDVPPDLTSPNQGDRYVIPAGTGAVRASDLNKGGVVKAQNSSVLQNVDNVYIEREGSQRWLVIDNRTPQQVWPMLKVFWQEMGFNIDNEEPNIGLLETGWAENRAKLPNDGFRFLMEKVGLGGVYSTSERDKFIIRLEREGKDGTRVTFVHKGMEEVYTDKKKEETIWQPRQADSNLEAAFLGRFMQRFGADESVIKKQLEQQQAGVGAELAVIENNTIVLRQGENSTRNFRRVGLALDRIGLTVVDQNTEQAAYLVQPALAESTVLTDKKPGIFSRMFGKKAVTPEQKAQLIVSMKSEPNKTYVIILNQDGSPYTGSDLKNYLSRLQTELR